MVKVLNIVVALLVAVVFARRPKWHELSENYSYQQYLIDFKKRYNTPEQYALHEKQFQSKLKMVLEHNANPAETYKRGVNKFTDRTEAENSRLRGARVDLEYAKQSALEYTPSKDLKAAKEVDYRKNFPAVITGVKDQGDCGDCWAHAVTESIESAYALQTGQLFTLSQEQVTSCTPAYGGCFACGGSFPSLGFDYIATTGITEEWMYGFQSYRGENNQCQQTTSLVPVVNISNYLDITANNQTQMIQALNELGPMSILVDASSWDSYESGIFNGCKYNVSLDHAVNVVGYGTEGSQDYWIVRNSWSPAWGELGYIRLAMPSTPECGWNVGAQHSFGCKGEGPAQSWACGACGILFAPQFPLISKK